MTEIRGGDMCLREDLRGLVPESWACIDCGFNTAPGCFNREQMERAFQAANIMADGIPQTINKNSEIYAVRQKVWAAAGVAPYGGCLCIGCLERRIGRPLKPKERIANWRNEMVINDHHLKQLPAQQSAQSDTGDRTTTGAARVRTILDHQPGRSRRALSF